MILEFLKQKSVMVKKNTVGIGIHKTANRSLYLHLNGSVNFPVKSYSFLICNMLIIIICNVEI